MAEDNGELRENFHADDGHLFGGNIAGLHAIISRNSTKECNPSSTHH
jgi:hypothetical protein